MSTLGRLISNTGICNDSEMGSGLEMFNKILITLSIQLELYMSDVELMKIIWMEPIQYLVEQNGKPA